ncbi:DUF1566 domain-containing protein [Parabacteroides faecis]|uniref:DUF1566 domain-containing protein n=1 Tax=Parabacteroides faecis TaxID=1217282 RepID=UPI002164974B|nr:DUF1566 domain-containing protein [Parabacteroides faecis]MCS2894318.1 DUF1566 domain-containing protein [Parabacteroides faecis]UVQ47100.1 DUF1566 domain-containing protein [Parabacteroides faecis]
MKRELFIVAIALWLLPAATAFGQELRKEKLKGTTGGTEVNYAVFYSVGLPESAVWPLGMDLSRDGATIRHTPVQDNEGHTSVNDKAPYRFIIAPLDGGEVKYWAATMGFNTGTGGANTDLEASGGSENIGCRAYGTTEFPTGWRMPTQREMMIMWLFREGINAIYSGGKIGQDSETRYWTATEHSADKAWYLDFSNTVPQSNTLSKATVLKFRCVRDF